MRQIVIEAKNLHAAVECPACHSLLIAKRPPTTPETRLLVSQCQVCQATIPGKPLLREILDSLDDWSKQNIKFVFTEPERKEG